MTEEELKARIEALKRTISGAPQESEFADWNESPWSEEGPVMPRLPLPPYQQKDVGSLDLLPDVKYNPPQDMEAINTFPGEYVRKKRPK